MKILVIPDVHMKTWIFDRADELIEQEKPDKIVQLGDLPDDWGMELHAEAYAALYDRAEKFRDAHPDVLWCYGNHDMSYVWDLAESGMAVGLVKNYVRRRIVSFYEGIPAENKAFLHLIDGCLFSHAGLTSVFLEINVLKNKALDEVMGKVNAMTEGRLWQEDSPIWARPQSLANTPGALFMENELIQVVGHTPVKAIIQTKKLISCDVFSTDREGQPIGTNEFLLIDSETGKWCGIK